jgi:hypothetical protein
MLRRCTVLVSNTVNRDSSLFGVDSRVVGRRGWLMVCGPAGQALRAAEEVLLCVRVVRSKLKMMSSVKEIEEAVLRLSAAELAAFRSWFAEFEADAWDCRIEEDAAAGRLDALADEAIEDLRAGRCTER